MGKQMIFISVLLLTKLRLLLKTAYLKNINLILAFIINIIAQPIVHLNISSAFIV